LRNSFFFRRYLDFYDFDFYNKIYFDFDYDNFGSPLILAFGKKFFFNKFFIYHLTFKIFFFFKKHGFFFPFGFINFLKKMFFLSFSLKYREINFLFESGVNLLTNEGKNGDSVDFQKKEVLKKNNLFLKRSL
jgi:hypothetical protein